MPVCLCANLVYASRFRLVVSSGRFGTFPFFSCYLVSTARFGRTRQREDSHQLVTRGVYRFLRHPSYFGWFWWSLGTQVGGRETLRAAPPMDVLGRRWTFAACHVGGPCIRPNPLHTIFGKGLFGLLAPFGVRVSGTVARSRPSRLSEFSFSCAETKLASISRACIYT